jgi:very-short-patch-repair endonuclease
MSNDKKTNNNKQLSFKKIKHLYEVENKSWAEIAEYYNTYANKILRFVQKNSDEENTIVQKTRSEVQSQSLKKGRRKHPTQGKKRPEEVKRAIGTKQSKNWTNLSNDEKERRSEMARDAWDSKTDEEKENMRQAAIQGVLKASKEGSKFEIFVQENLLKDGYTVEPHKEDLIAIEKLHIDAFLPDYGIAIEIDGPAHFLPIWGDEKLHNHEKKDLHKNSILLRSGFTVLRVKCMTKNVSKTKMIEAYEKIKKEIEDIKNNPKQKHNELIEIEVQ